MIHLILQIGSERYSNLLKESDTLLGIYCQTQTQVFSVQNPRSFYCPTAIATLYDKGISKEKIENIWLIVLLKILS